MKTAHLKWHLLFGLCMLMPLIQAQDTLYIYKAGLVVYKSEVSNVDSITFSNKTNPGVSPYSAFFDINSIPQITLEITTSEWNNLLVYFDQNPDNQEYIKSNFTFLKDGKSVSIPDTGIRIRGNTSRRRPEGTTGQSHNPINTPWHHASFALNFKKYLKSQTMSGLDKINLKWFKVNPTYDCELYCYDRFELSGIEQKQQRLLICCKNISYITNWQYLIKS